MTTVDDTIHRTVLDIWRKTEPTLRKDPTGRELFKLLLHRVYKKLLYQNANL